jgi:hypothetical protein
VPEFNLNLGSAVRGWSRGAPRVFKTMARGKASERYEVAAQVDSSRLTFRSPIVFAFLKRELLDPQSTVRGPLEFEDDSP